MKNVMNDDEQRAYDAGFQAGLNDGIAKGTIKGRADGRLDAKLSMVRILAKKVGISRKNAAKLLGIPKEEIENVKVINIPQPKS